MVRDLFAFLDANENDQLCSEELSKVSSKKDSSTKISGGYVCLFPHAAKDVIEVQLLPAIVNVITKYEVVAKSALNDDGDGHVQRSEVGMYYNRIWSKFMEVSKTNMQMGPMLFMFGGADMVGI